MPTVCDPTHVRNMNMNKEVATRLFRMLAVSEQTANTIKHDHASYAKLHLLSQQMLLLQAQTEQTVAKSLAKAQADNEGDIQLTEKCTALSPEYDEGAKRLLTIMAVDKTTVDTIKRDTPACAKLSLLADQASMLQQQAQQALSDSEVNCHLFEVASRVTCKLVPGTMYYHYSRNGDEVLSRIADDEWTFYDEYHGKYLYDWDFTFRRQPLASEEWGHEASQPMLMLLPNVVANPPTPTSFNADQEISEAETAKTPMRSDLRAPICAVHSRWT
eukprot:CAMPEP_0119065402 /NCGR_PEP_ID=MMETSP1178-20130426/8230_1 /TAXON_ID=33656 /ORGANISM="unid sp, Strain CCMP2000" /LENGTH=272 /DNA_ID=CAMNT_0007046913 /DNA_START=51 /DNA_END=869 /DNA_ORIENTATION=-